MDLEHCCWGPSVVVAAGDLRILLLGLSVVDSADWLTMLLLGPLRCAADGLRMLLLGASQAVGLQHLVLGFCCSALSGEVSAAVAFSLCLLLVCLGCCCWGLSFEFAVVRLRVLLLGSSLGSCCW